MAGEFADWSNAAERMHKLPICVEIIRHIEVAAPNPGGRLMLRVSQSVNPPMYIVEVANNKEGAGYARCTRAATTTARGSTSACARAFIHVTLGGALLPGTSIPQKHHIWSWVIRCRREAELRSVR
jgi:hypothetical protein